MKHLFSLLILAISASTLNAKDAPIDRIEPAFWWAGMEHHQVEIMNFLLAKQLVIDLEANQSRDLFRDALSYKVLAD